MKNKVIDINTLMTLACAGAIGTGDWVEGAAVVSLFALSEWLQTQATEKARDAIKAVMELRPEEAELVDGKLVKVEEVAIGALLAVRPGAKVPLDGVVRSGASYVDEASITGESRPVRKREGDKVQAGTINQSGYLEVATTARAEDSAVARLVRLVEDAQAQRSPSELVIESFAKVYTPIVIFCALCLAVVPWFVTDEVTAKKWLYQALVLLVVACPCALVISTPLTYVCALATAAKKGMLIKGGAHLETLGRLSVLAIDKTGTLTEGRFQMRELDVLSEKEFPRARVLGLIAAAEGRSSHPLAVAVVRTAKTEGVDIPRKVEDYKTLEAEGIACMVDGLQVHIGNRRLAKRLGWVSGDGGGDGRAEEWERSGCTVCWVGVGGKLVGVFGVADTPRPEAQEAMQMLKDAGIRTVMLTGDNNGTAEAVRKLVGLTEVRAELLPEDKVRIVSELKKQMQAGTEGGCFGSKLTIAMVGDGINDAAALARSDVGIAMGAGGTAAAMETAHVALMDSDLRKLAAAVMLGKETLQRIRENVVVSLVTKAIMITLAGLGVAPLWLAIVTGPSSPPQARVSALRVSLDALSGRS